MNLSSLNVDVLEMIGGNIVANRKGLYTGVNLNIQSQSSGILQLESIPAISN